MPKVATKRSGRPRKYLSLASFNYYQATNLPSVHRLCQKLDYAFSDNRRHIDFYNTVANYITGFKSLPTIANIRTLYWRNRVHRQLILDMATGFLETDKNGQFFWPDDCMQANYGRLQYSKHYGLIQETMLVLFFQILMKSPDDHPTPTVEFRVADANTPGSGQDQVSNVGPADTYHSGVEQVRSPGGGTLGDSVRPDDSQFSTAPDDERTDAEPNIMPPPEATFRPRAPTIEDILDESFRSHNQKNRMPSPDELATTSPGLNSWPAHRTGESARGRIAKHRKGKQPIYPDGQGADTGFSHQNALQFDGSFMFGSQARQHYKQPARQGNTYGGESSRANEILNDFEQFAGGREEITQDEDSSQSSSQQSRLVTLNDVGQDGGHHGERTNIPVPSSTKPKPTGTFERALSRDPEPRRPLGSLKTDYVVSVFRPSGRNRRWTPRTGISAMSLQRLFEVLPVPGGFTGLDICLRVPGNVYEERLLAGDDDLFEMTLSRYAETIEQFKREHRHWTRRVVFEILIKPICYVDE
ncbi:hypothetical protein EDB81DRAFT_202456 [Dactylonectria macrodidyma]|uniref:Uncharacterized protein n=1 Tax=Dactylonectria macrodidyma TaxID=307937 RepID=A0A9P9IMP2_9HYPO|nr:hypothetical protein EDB81DRAFT_202456 [Dactylonectria macrodidyma]